jgi:hypothetical protein
MKDSPVPSPFPTNPFPADHRRCKDWETGSRDAQEELSRFAADHLKMLPAESEDGKVFDAWEIDAFAGRFDIMAKAYCTFFVSDYRLADLYSKELLPDLLRETLSLVRPVQAQNAYFLSELEIRLAQRQFHWIGKALECARKAEQAKNCTTNGDSDAVEILGVSVNNPRQDQVGMEGPGAMTESSGDKSTRVEAAPAVNGTNRESGGRNAMEPPAALQLKPEPDGDSAQKPNKAQPEAAVTPVAWADVEISFLSDVRVHIRRGASIETYNYAELGFADARVKHGGTPKPNLAWVTLRAMAEQQGLIRNGSTTGTAWRKVEKQMQVIRKALRKRFNISADPVPFIAGTGYRACFKISCAPSYHT